SRHAVSPPLSVHDARVVSAGSTVSAHACPCTQDIFAHRHRSPHTHGGAGPLTVPPPPTTTLGRIDHVPLPPEELPSSGVNPPRRPHRACPPCQSTPGTHRARSRSRPRPLHRPRRTRAPPRAAPRRARRRC